MAPKKISRTLAVNLKRLIAGEILNASAFRNKQQISKLEEDRVVERFWKTGNRSAYHCLNHTTLRNYLRVHFGIANLDTYIELLDRKNCDGEDSLQATTSTKILRQHGLQGFLVKAFSTDLKVNQVTLDPLSDGVEYFVHAPESLSISPSALVIGVENPECFVKAKRLLYLFPSKELVFVMRYHSNNWLQWLESIDNDYLHFGDFDPAGIAIYCNECLSRLDESRCHFFVPDKIEELLKKYGLRELYDRQAHQMPSKAKIHQPKLLSLIDSINRHGKGLEQERLLL